MSARKKSKKDLKATKFGEHLIFDAYGCKYEKLANMEFCFNVLNNLAEIAEMKKISEPYVVRADENLTLGGKDPGGFSGFLIIQESHASIHTFAKRGFVTIDLYSCKSFDHEKVVKHLKKVFEPKSFDVLNIDRGLKYPTENIY